MKTLDDLQGHLAYLERVWDQLDSTGRVSEQEKIAQQITETLEQIKKYETAREEEHAAGNTPSDKPTNPEATPET